MSEGVSTADLIEALARRYAPDQIAQFEALSGLMLLNIEQDAYMALSQRFADNKPIAADVPVLAAINHEAYHFAQAAASGYMFDRQRTTMRVFNAGEPIPDPPLDPETMAIIEQCRSEAGDDPELNARVDRMLWIVEEKQRLEILEARATPGDHSLDGALFPHLFAHFRDRSERESKVNSHGLSILGLLEGSAVIHPHLLIHGIEKSRGSVPAEIATLGPVYGELFAVTGRLAGERSLEVVLPATAVALCYTHPHEAYCALVPMIASAPHGEALARGRSLFEAPPAIEAAGPWLGDAVAQRQPDDSYKLYDRVLDALRTGQWGIGSYDLLADPQAMHRVTSFPLGLVTRSACHSPFELDEAAGRLWIAGMVLQSRSRRRDQRRFQKVALAWMRDVFRRSFT